MCTYNGERYLREQLESIAGQTLLPGELVICDDGSVDTTRDIVADFCRIAPLKVKFIINSINLGSTKNFEKAINACSGEFIALCDQDDVWYPNKIEVLSEFLNSNQQFGGVFSDADLIDERSRLTGKRQWGMSHFHPPNQRCITSNEMANILLMRNVVTGATLMVRAATRSTILPIPELWVHDGWIAWMLVLHSKIAPVPSSLIRYRTHVAQQVGLGHASIRAKVISARQTGKDQYVLSARQFEVLYEHCKKNANIISDEFLGAIEGKIQHSLLRASLPDNRLIRASKIIAAHRSYRRYSRGFLNMCMDIIV
jgi:glycosyltransferase involved in cell wall biosynthesis